MSKDDRALRFDNRSNHLSSQEVTRRKSGDVIRLTPEEITTMDPKRPTQRNITAEENAAQLARARTTTFADQKIEIERLNAILLARVGAQIEKNQGDPDKHAAQLARCAGITKQFLAEERQQGDSRDPSQMTDEEIRQRLGR